MKSNKSLADYRHLIPLLGDIQVLSSVYRFVKPGKQNRLRLTFAQLFFNLLCVTAYPVRIFLRVQHSAKTMGWIVSLQITFYLVCLNSAHYSFWEAKYKPYLSMMHDAIIYFLKKQDWDTALSQHGWLPKKVEFQLQEELLSHHSEVLLIFTYSFLGLSVAHILLSYFRWGTNGFDICRGRPVLFFLSRPMRRLIPFHEYAMAWIIIESLLFAGVGVATYWNWQEERLGLFLMISGGCYWVTEGVERYWLRSII